MPPKSQSKKSETPAQVAAPVEATPVAAQKVSKKGKKEEVAGKQEQVAGKQDEVADEQEEVVAAESKDP